MSMLIALGLMLQDSAVAADWPEWGGGSDRNMVSTETGIPLTFFAG